MDLDQAHRELSRYVEGELRRDEPLATRTSVRVGGRADLFIRPASAAALGQALRIAAGLGLSWHILGGGANTLISDDGVRGLVVRLPNLLPASGDAVIRTTQGLEVTLGAGAPIAQLIEAQRKGGATGAEFLASVPGTIGGAVAMNAGTRHGWVQTVLASIEVVSVDGLRRLPASELAFSYRHTQLPAGTVVWSATFRLPFGDVAASEQQMADDIAYRRRTQPFQLPNSGSVFKNPPDTGAGKLIELAGLKGVREGGAQISELHANFIVNRGGAKAVDVHGLMNRAQSEVRVKSGIELEPEVKLVGAF